MSNSRKYRIVNFFLGAIFMVSLAMVGCGNNSDHGEQYGLNLEDPDIVSEQGPDMPDREEMLSQMVQQAEQQKTSITINHDPNFLDGTVEGDLFIHCQEDNEHPLVVQIIREDSDEVVYTSGTLYPGDEIKYEKLSAALAAGDYPCVAYFYAVDSTGEICYTGAIQITIHVQS